MGKVTSIHVNETGATGTSLLLLIGKPILAPGEPALVHTKNQKPPIPGRLMVRGLNSSSCQAGGGHAFKRTLTLYSMTSRLTTII